MKLKKKSHKQKVVVSIIITCYNLGNYITDAVESVVRQTYKHWELIIVDDGSTDENTISNLSKIGKRYPDIKIIRQKNAGLPSARNAGIESAGGRFIVCLDADDKLKPEYLEKTVSIMEDGDPSLGIVTTWLQMFEKNNNLIKIKHKSLHEILLMNGIHVSSMFRRSDWVKVGGYKPLMDRGYEDWEFWISILELGRQWAVVPEPLFYYRVRNTSMITESRKHHQELIGIIYDLHKLLYIDNVRELIKYSSDRLYQLVLIEENLLSKIDELNENLLSKIDELNYCTNALATTKDELNNLRIKFNSLAASHSKLVAFWPIAITIKVKNKISQIRRLNAR